MIDLFFELSLGIIIFSLALLSTMCAILASLYMWTLMKDLWRSK